MPSHRAIEIPEVLSHIATFLPPADLAHACRVSRSWFTVFIAQLWRTLSPDQFTDGHLLPSLPRYTSYVRDLCCARLMPLVDPGPGLSLLTAFTTPEIGKHSVELIIALLRRNADLRDVHLRCRLVIDTEYFSQLIDTLTGLRHLESLDMDTHKISANFIFLILKGLPGLKHLRLEETRKAPKWSLSRPQSPSDPNPHPLLFGLQKLRVVCRRLPLDPILEVVQMTPDLSALEMVALGGDQPSDLSALKKLAHTLHESCPRLRDVLLEEDEMSIRDFYHFLSLFDWINVRRWMPFRSLNFSNNCPSGSELLDLVLSGSEVLQDTLETLVIDNPTFTKSSSVRVVEILSTFRKLRKLSLGKTTCVIRVADLFNTVILDGRKRVKILKPWACKDLVMLNVWIEGEYCGWCPPGVVDIKDDYREDRFYRDGFPLYEQLKAQLDSYRRLDQKQIRYTYL